MNIKEHICSVKNITVMAFSNTNRQRLNDFNISNGFVFSKTPQFDDFSHINHQHRKSQLYQFF